MPEPQESEPPKQQTSGTEPDKPTAPTGHLSKGDFSKPTPPPGHLIFENTLPKKDEPPVEE